MFIIPVYWHDTLFMIYDNIVITRYFVLCLHITIFDTAATGSAHAYTQPQS